MTRAPAGAPVVGPRARNRAVLARQHLLERADLTIEAVLERIAGLQTQSSPSGYVGLWTRLRRFAREDLTRALEERRVVQGTLMRGTIHLVSSRDYWPLAIALRRGRREAVSRIRGLPSAAELEARSGRLRDALGAGPRSVAELGGLGSGFIGNLGLWAELLRVPPSGTWERRRADRLALADAWLGPTTVTEEEGLTHLVRSYLGGFGPAPLRDIAAWAGLPASDVARGAANLALDHLADEAGRELLDLPGAPRPDPDTPAPVRYLAPFDTTFFAHSSRAGILPEEHRRRILNARNAQSLGGVVVDGRIVAGWWFRAGRVQVEAFEQLGPGDLDELAAEREALERFHL